MVVDGERLDWTPGEATVCDTTFFHSAHNEHPTEDVYLVHLDVFHPGLSADERHALEALSRHLAAARRRRAAALLPPGRWTRDYRPGMRAATSRPVLLPWDLRNCRGDSSDSCRAGFCRRGAR